jgi:hypothetical protein
MKNIHYYGFFAITYSPPWVIDANLGIISHYMSIFKRQNNL